MKELLSNLLTLFKLTYQGWKEDRASRLSAALAYYTIFSLAPLLIIVIAIAGLIWQADIVRTQLLDQIRALVGVQGADFIAGMITNIGSPAEDIIASLIGIITLIIGAMGVFNELHNSLNIIWDVAENETRGFWQAVKKAIIDRFLSFTMILGIGFLLLVSLVISTGLSATQETISSTIPLSEIVLQTVNLIISIGAITLLFAMIYKILPDAEIAWRDVWVGAFVTSILFSLGKTAIGLYLGNSTVASSFGAAGSLVLLLLWIYYSAQILFFGAEFTQVYANKFGSKIVPEGEKAQNFVQPEARQRQDQRLRPAIPVTSGALHRERRIERENQQTARFVFGLIAAAFLSGIVTTIFGFRRRQ